MINHKHKDRLFNFIFGSEENKQWTLSLYNAVSHSCHTNLDDIQITTMDDVIYMGMKNDVSFIITNIMNIYEQQSTFNPNMPLRKLMYAARLYDKYIHDNKLNIYSTSLLQLPVPKLVTFYNGQTNKDDMVLELVDAFKESIEMSEVTPDISVKVRMININYGRNKELQEACRPLAEYAWFIENIRKYGKTMDLKTAVGKTLDDMPDNFEIKQFLIGNRAEVTQMCITEYNEEETMQMFREEGRKEGREEGRKEGKILEQWKSCVLSTAMMK